MIKLAAPTTNQKRLEDIIKISSGFIYQVNVSGVTGVKSANVADVTNFVKRIKSLTNIPVCSGFGIKSPEDAKKVAELIVEALTYHGEESVLEKVRKEVAELLKSHPLYK